LRFLRFLSSRLWGSALWIPAKDKALYQPALTLTHCPVAGAD